MDYRVVYASWDYILGLFTLAGLVLVPLFYMFVRSVRCRHRRLRWQGQISYNIYSRWPAFIDCGCWCLFTRHIGRERQPLDEIKIAAQPAPSSRWSHSWTLSLGEILLVVYGMIMSIAVICWLITFLLLLDITSRMVLFVSWYVIC